ncbi:DNA/RNA nuclease SfsA [Kaarinaea lacus]
MRFSAPLYPGVLVRRYKRFLADVVLDSGEDITAHTANTGAMTGCSEPGSRVWLSRSDNIRRKYAYTWELVEVPGSSGKTLVGINTMMANHLVKEAWQQHTITELQQYDFAKAEVRYGKENSRIDLLLENQTVSPALQCYVEVKNVTLAKDGVGYFPDAKSERACKHLRELMYLVEQGSQAVIFFCVPREDVDEVRPADRVDPVYGDTLRQAAQNGVQTLAYKAQVSPEQINLTSAIPVNLS